MQRRILHAILATALVAFIAVPTVASDAGASVEARRAVGQLLPDERDEPLQLLTLVGPALAIGILTVVGLTITFRALRHDIRRRRIVYRPRRH